MSSTKQTARAIDGLPLKAYLLAIAVSCALGACSLALPSVNTADAWHWLLWGRELSHLNLDLTGTWVGWKPLPAFFTVQFGLISPAAPSLWLVVARASGIVTLCLSWHLARTLTGLRREHQAIKSTPSGPIAGTFAVLLSFQLIFAASLNGFSEGLVAALCLAAVERALSGHNRSALVLGLIAALGRPEALPIAVAFGLVKTSRDRKFAPALIAGPLLVLAAWLIPDWAATGEFGQILRQASDYHLQSPSPAWAKGGIQTVPDLFTQVLPVGGWIATIAGVAVAGSAALKGERRPLAVAAAALAWILISVLEVAIGGPAITRYLAPPAVVMAVMAGYGAGVVAAWLTERLCSSGRIGDTAVKAGVAVLGMVVVVGFAAASTAPKAVKTLSRQEVIADSMAELDWAIVAAGGRERVSACLPIARRASSEAAIAWKLGLHLSDFSNQGSLVDPKMKLPFTFGTTIRSTKRGRFQNVLGRPDRIAAGSTMIGTYGRWQIWQKCNPGSP
jgi:hypothetical protein